MKLPTPEGAAKLDPDILLWKPEAKTIFIPKMIQPAPILITNRMHDAIVKGIKGMSFNSDITMDLTHATIEREGFPDGWAMIARCDKMGTFIPRVKTLDV